MFSFSKDADKVATVEDPGHSGLQIDKEGLRLYNDVVSKNNPPAPVRMADCKNGAGMGTRTPTLLA